MSTDNPVIVLIFLIYSLVLCWGNISNSNVTMKFAQLHYFSSQNVGGTKDIMSLPVQKLGGTCPPDKRGPWLQTSEFLSFAHVINSNESQSKAQFNLQSLGENKTGYRADNIKFVSTDLKLQEKSAFVYTAFLYPSDNVLLCKAMLVRYQLVITVWSNYRPACGPPQRFLWSTEALRKNLQT